MREIFFAGTFFFADREKTAKIAKIRTRKNLVSHGTSILCQLS